MEMRTAVLSPFAAYFLSDAGQDLGKEVSVSLSCWEHKGQSIHLFWIFFFISYKYADILSSWRLLPPALNTSQVRAAQNLSFQPVHI